MEKSYFDRVDRIEGSLQSDRMPSALSSGYVGIDDRNLSDLLRALSAYARIIRFYDIDNKPAGSWNKLFENNEILVVAEAAQIGINRLKNEHRRQRSLGLVHSIEFTSKIVRAIAQWLTASQRFSHVESKALAIQIRAYAKESLSDSYGVFIHLAERLKSKDTQFLSSFETELYGNNTLRAHQMPSSREQQETALNQFFDTVLEIRRFLSEKCKKLFYFLLQSNGHEPAVTMLIAFLESYQSTQLNINTLPKKLHRFYYNQLHRNNLRKGKPDRAFLHCQSTSFDPFIIRQGATFLAGKSPDLKDVVYQAEMNSIITGAKLSSVQTVYLQRHNKISPENSTQAVTAVKHQALLSENNPQITFLSNLFGSDEVPGENNQQEDAEFGLCIQSDHLDLKQGTRHIAIQIDMVDRTLQRLIVNQQSESGVTESVIFQDLTPEVKKIAVDLYRALPRKLTRYSGLMRVIQAFFRKNRLPPKIDEESLKQFLRKFFLYLYMNIEDVHSLGLVHREINIRRIFFHDYLNKIEIEQLLKRIQTLNSQLPSLVEMSQISRSRLELMFKDIERDLLLSDKAILLYYLGNVLKFRLTGENGWFSPREYEIHRVGRSNRVCFSLRLQKTDPAVVVPDLIKHGFQGLYPALQMMISPTAAVFPYSYLRGVAVSTCNIKVSVKGYRDLTVLNDYGQVDTSQPFLAFSAAPSSSSRLRIGGFEFARKRTKKIRMHIRWNNIPTNYGGFSEYYRAYGAGYATDNYSVTVQILVGGEPIPQDPALHYVSPLFLDHPVTRQLNARTQIDFPVIFKPPRVSAALTEQEYRQFNQHQTGYINLALNSKSKLFGHKDYNQVLSDTLVYNTRKKRKKALPESPYTPEIKNIELDYAAEDEIVFVRDLTAIQKKSSEKDPRSFAYYFTPLGNELNQKPIQESGFTLLPEWLNDGNLYLAFDISNKADALNIYFQLRENSTHTRSLEKSKLDWHYYSETGWKSVPLSAILSDSTNGLRRSGVIQIELPKDKARHLGLIPSNRYWFRLSGSTGLAQYASLEKLVFDTITVKSADTTLKLNSVPSVSDHPGISDKWQAIPAIAGVQSYRQYEAAISQPDEETDEQAERRLNEQLRHKNRAITPWDFERLVLQRFPQVDRVKCLPACRLGDAKPSPGIVTVIVSPRLADIDNIHAQGHHLNAVVLGEIRRYLMSLSFPHIRIEVNNAHYEVVRVRCAVSFFDKIGYGLRIKQLNGDLSRFLSPWAKTGMQLGLGWKIRIKDVESFIRQLTYVKFATQVSLLKVYRDLEKTDFYHLEDTAAREDYKRAPHSDPLFIQAVTPWTLPVPSERHDIVLLEGDAEERAAQPVGINTMEIGGTFILEEGHSHV